MIKKNDNVILYNKKVNNSANLTFDRPRSTTTGHFHQNWQIHSC